MEEVYVRKDSFEETLKRMEAMQAASEARTAALIAEIRAEVKAYKAENDANIKAYKAESDANIKAYKTESDARLLEYRADSRRESESLASDIRAIKDRLDSIESAATRRWTIAGVFVAIVSAGITLFSIIPAVRAYLGL